MIAALGCRSFAAVCEAHVGTSTTQADRLVDIVTHMSREEALTVGPTRAASLVAFVRATPEAENPSDLLRRGARVHGKTLDARNASTRAIARAAAALRSTRSSRGGRSVTREERAACVALEKALRRARAKDATVAVKTGRVAGAARAVIDIAAADIERLARAVRLART